MTAVAIGTAIMNRLYCVVADAKVLPIGKAKSIRLGCNKSRDGGRREDVSDFSFSRW